MPKRGEFWRNRAVDSAAGAGAGLIVGVLDYVLDRSLISAPLAALIVFALMMLALPIVRRLSERRWTDAP